MQFAYKIPQNTIVRAFVTGNSSKKTVGQVAAEFHVTVGAGNHSLVINGDGFPASPFKSNSIWYSNGTGKNTSPMGWRPWVNFSVSHILKIDWPPNSHWNNYNAFSLTRRLVIDGAINPAFSDTGELNARIGCGVTASGDLVICGIDGRDMPAPSLGWTITELGNQLIAQGVVEGGDGDGGGSVTLALDGVVANEPNDDGVPGQRAVVNHLCLELTVLPGEAPPPVEPPPPVTGWPDKIVAHEGTETKEYFPV